MRVGVAGAGRIGRLHSEVLGRLPEVDAVLVADLEVSRATAIAEELGVEAVGSPERLLKAGLDALVVAASADAHPALVLGAAGAGIPVFCEKPIALDVRESWQVVRSVEDSGAVVQVGFQRRFDPGFEAARQAVQGGEVGWLHTVWSVTLDPAPPAPEYVAGSGGLFRDCSVHDVDAVRWVTGREVVEAFAYGTNRGERFFAEHGDVDTGAALLTLDDGTLAVLGGTRYNGNGYDVRMELLGSARSLVVGLDERTPLASAQPGVAWPSGPPYTDFMDRFYGAYVAELQAFVRLASGEGENRCPPREALEAAYVAEACEVSRHEHRAVRVEELRT